MAYFNGTLHGFNGPGGYVPSKPTTAVYCDACAEEAIPLPSKEGWKGAPGGRHWGTEFKWAPRYGAPCHVCGSDA